MIQPAEFAKHYNREDLIQAYEEIQAWRKTGLLKEDGIVRTLAKEVINPIEDISLLGMDLKIAERVIMDEIARRYVAY